MSIVEKLKSELDQALDNGEISMEEYIEEIGLLIALGSMGFGNANRN